MEEVSDDNRPMRPRALDIVAFIVSCLIVSGACVRAYGGFREDTVVFIQSFDGEQIFPRHEMRAVNVEGPLGVTRIVVGEGEAHVESSPCGEKICIRMGSISKTGQWIACLPNGVIVTMKPREARGVDAVSY